MLNLFQHLCEDQTPESIHKILKRVQDDGQSNIPRIRHAEFISASLWRLNYRSEMKTKEYNTGEKLDHERFKYN